MQFTEQRNPKTIHIDRMDTISMLNVINEENYNSVKAVENATNEIARAVDIISDGFENSGRLFYVGAGTSGRLGVIDAAECPPTFGVPQSQVVGIIAGGEKCMTQAAEGQEDDELAGRSDLERYNLNEHDTVVGISASGGASYVVGALKLAKECKANTVSIANNVNTLIEKYADVSITAITGPEVITGSTRMKAGTAQKLILNMISTCAMIKTGKVYENLMINLKPSNLKLKKRMIGIVCQIMQCDENKAEDLLAKNNWDIKGAVGGIKYND